MTHNPLTSAETRGTIMMLHSFINVIDESSHKLITKSDLETLIKGLEED